MNSTRFPSTPARTPRHIARGCWPHPTPLSRSERKARAARRFESAETEVLRTPEGLAGATTRTVRAAIAAQKKPGPFSRFVSGLAARLGRALRRFVYAGVM